MNGTWLAWGALGLALAAGGGAGSAMLATLLVVLGGVAVGAPKPHRVVLIVVVLGVGWGGLRAAAIDRAARPVTAQPLRAAAVLMLETLPAHGPALPDPGAARARWEGRTVVVTPARFGSPTPALRRGWIVEAEGRLMPLGAGAGDRRLARQGVAGRLLLAAARDRGRRRGGMIGAVDAVARDTAAAASAAGGPRAGPLLVGMALGTAEEVAPDDRDALQAAGLWHLAAASGGNIALVVALCLVLGWIIGLPDRGRIALALLAVVSYVPLAGAGPSIQRAGVMGVAALLALWAGREHRTVDALGLAAAATLAFDPRAWADVGWQLSFAATAALLFGAGPLALHLRRLGLPRPVGLPLAATAVATAATTPIMLAAFGSVSLSGLLTNVAAAPIAAVTVWSGTLAALATPFSADLARLLAEPGAAGAHATLAIADWGAGRAHAQLGSSAVVLAVAGAAVLALIRPGRAGSATAGVVLVMALVLDVPHPPGVPRLVVFDIGQGSAALLQDGGDAVLVDAGPVDGGVVGQLRRAGVRRLRAIVLSHPAADHDGGAAAVLRAFPTDLVLDGGEPGGGPTHAAAIAEARRRGVRTVPVRAGQRFKAGGIDVAIRWPTPQAAHRPGDPNDRAAVVDATLGRGGLRALLPADAEGNVLTGLRGLKADVLVVSHHGSADTELPRLLRRLRPRVAVISVGAHNDYRHPRPETLAALRDARVSTLRTDQGGSVDVRRAADRLTIRRIATAG